ncbi:CD209 antigen-like protein E [Engraulis encrasicolus]|uniref:CD209 antigen-like protein E n=1 Tax=Engraulis encrasicolus TaxID=184585 RepID=UPI002FD4948C
MAEEIYANADDLEMSSQEKDKSTCANARPEDAVDSNPSAAVRNYSRWTIGGLGMLCVLLLALGIGVTVLYMKERDQLQDISMERDQLQAEKQQLLSSYDDISMERDQLLANNTNLTRQVEQLHATEIKLQDRISKLTKPCPSGWLYHFNTKCYRYHNTAKTWSDSRAHCQSQGGDLVVIGSREEQVFIHGLARGKTVWIGLKRVNGKWKWVNNDEASTTFWYDGQPDNGGEECGVLDSSGNPLSSWHDYYCSTEHAVLCQISSYM